MHHVLRYVFLVCLLVLPCDLGAGAIDPAKLIGKWRCIEGNLGEMIIAFRIDGTFNGYIRLRSHPDIQFSGTWTFTDGKIIFDYEYTTHPDVPFGSDGAAIVVELNDAQLTTFAEGKETKVRKTFYRVTD